VSFIDHSLLQEEPSFPLVDTPDDQVCPEESPRDVNEHLNPMARRRWFEREEAPQAGFEARGRAWNEKEKALEERMAEERKEDDERAADPSA
jgi:actin-related protein 5